MPPPRAACWRRRALAASFVPMRDERVAETTQDAVLGGRLALRQPRHGHRVGHDAILLAAATQARPGERAVDLFAGVGAAGLALALRVPRLDVTFVEIDPALVTLARDNIARNDLSDRARAVVLDVDAPAREFSAAAISAASADRVLMNPPFNDPLRQRVSPQAGRRLALAQAERRAHADLAGGRPCPGARRACRPLRGDRGAAGPRSSRCRGDPRAAARRQVEPRAAPPAARLGARRCGGPSHGRGRGGAARKRRVAARRVNGLAAASARLGEFQRAYRIRMTPMFAGWKRSNICLFA